VRRRAHTPGEDAYRKIRAGASLVELYTAFAYDGPALIPAIKQQLAACLARDGFGSVAEAVGADHRRRGDAARRRSWGGSAGARPTDH
jgi:dihydroorotate dehydrogenase